MWELENRTPYKAERAWLQDADGGKRWVVVVKGTFTIGDDGRTALAGEQLEPLFEPEYHGCPGSSSLRYEADMILPKPGTDVYVNGHAYAPGGAPTARMEVALGVGSRQPKVLEVIGDRVYQMALGRATPSLPRAFERMPLVYERAFGGYDCDDPDPSKHELFAPNPIGVGVATLARKLLGRPAPNIGALSGDKSGAAGLGAVCSYWQPRRELGGTYDEAWTKTRKPLLPEDFDPSFWMCAPVDQQFIPHLRGGERVTLRNMSPGGLLAFDLPKVFLSLETSIATRSKPKHHRAALHSVIIEPDFPRVIMVWHGSLRCHREADFLDQTRIVQKEYRKL
ncbi:DUF2169 domain-containing protein [Pseudenhygromyxa sp. WMMC2535]|uniref:DUF2169 family type VI secretion system accessory protein n=1 Tax=Pseudenhygromyxa sp. WMMC2535 TaxID=2712867 RepID=UPI001594F36B|nr:DUF2169 domain-containing protein [Pseudenhygromyxa sp. WMMC2535]NVB38378.1 DUF2169 domain-containing protein [Pseudenhygromyxa sp. WMMC2535]